ncbi:hypothetical protein A2690_04645 [Candidatus Roizmanbacteria bacterium RIFCSPHIGHO2_01_FULL_39_12b]|uniref:ribose-phosphate diphosphokinase n=1 Tax=Candidatus Roizmanbacteria bacterium RIFCSPHIGHO2_01_FULL_39_12b TaxID=1802030 RepID=A0A1F7G7P6_9BACT|nr:MAG: hypothetical protein A2690_04645 [Candidatus Roizmanbacteria bacterium RIFCSPHIGHO2_01_FULL_39_12b]
MATCIFSGSSSQSLTSLIARSLGKSLSKAKIQRFPNHECKVTVQSSVKNSRCILVQSISSPADENLVELLFFCDALKREGASEVIGIIPYLGYARQNKQHLKGESVSLGVVANVLKTAGFDKIITVTIHKQSSKKLFSMPFKNIDATSFLSKKIFQYLKQNKIIKKGSDCAVVAPDRGAVVQARRFSNTSVVVVNKERDKQDGSIAIHSIFGSVEGKVAIIVDDVVTSGNTLIESAKLCVKKGASLVFAAVVHQDLIEDTIPKLEKSPISKLFTTDTIRQDIQSAKLIEFSVSKLIASKIRYLL